MLTADVPERLETQLEQTWKQLAHDRYVNGTSPQVEPVALIVAAQPGAGKSAMAEAAREAFRGAGGCATIDPGELLTLHPAYGVYAADDDHRADTLLRPAAAHLAAELLESAAARRTHMVLECTFEDADSAEALADYLRDEGYRTTLLVPVVIQDVSWRSLERRLSKQRAAHGLGRRISKEYHDHMCRVLVDSVERLARMQLVDELCLVSRDGEVLSSMDSVRGFDPGVTRDILAQSCESIETIGAAEENVGPDWKRYSEQEQKVIRRRIELQEVLRRCAEQERHGGY